MKKDLDKNAARQQVLEYFAQAAKESSNQEKAQRLVTKARRIAMRYRMRLPREIKRSFCKHCHAYFVPGKTVRVRTHLGKVVFTCFLCKKFTRIPYTPRRKAKKK